MLATFVEGVGEVVLPCSLGMLAPGLAAVLLGWWRSLLAFAVFLAVASLTAWARAADLFALQSDLVLGASALSAMVVAWALWRSLLAPIGAALFLGFFAGSTWQPCVGQRLAEILNGAPQDPAAYVLPMVAYVAGLTMLLGVLSLVPIAFPRLRIVRPRVAPMLGAVLTGVLGIGQFTGLYGDVLSEFAQLTTR